MKLLSSCRWEIFWSISRVGEDRTCLTSHRDGGEIPPSCVPDWNLLAQCIEAVGVRAPWPADAWKVNNRRLEVSTTVSPQSHSLARRTCTHVFDAISLGFPVTLLSNLCIRERAAITTMNSFQCSRCAQDQNQKSIKTNTAGILNLGDFTLGRFVLDPQSLRPEVLFLTFKRTRFIRYSMRHQRHHNGMLTRSQPQKS